MDKPTTVTNINGFLSPEEAEAHRNKLFYKDLYGLYGIYKDEQTQLWVPMPLKILTAIMEFRESEEAKLKEKNTQQDGDCKHCVNGCSACDARRQPNVLS